MNASRNGCSALLAALCALVICGCARLQPVNVAQEPERGAVNRGDTVVVTTETGEIHTFTIVDITEGGIHGREFSVPFSEIRLLQIRRLDTRKTVLLTLGVIGLGAIASGDDGGY